MARSKKFKPLSVRRLVGNESPLAVRLSAIEEGVRLEMRGNELIYSPHASIGLRRRIESNRAALMELICEL